MANTISPFCSYVNLTTKCNPRKNGLRDIDTITIHMYVGQVTAKSGVDYFKNNGKKNSVNYVVGHDGSIGCSVPEESRAWTTGSRENDYRAITIETACDKEAPFSITEAAYRSLVALCADIAARYNMNGLRWSNDKNLIGKTELQNITLHKWFENTSCPGEDIIGRLPKLVSDVNTILDVKIQNGEKTVPFFIKVTDPYVKIYKSPDGLYMGKATGIGTFTIIEVKDNWGKLKSGIGWINLNDVTIA